MPEKKKDCPLALVDIKKVYDDSDGDFHYSVNVFERICCGFKAHIVHIVLCFPLPIACIIIGALHIGECRISSIIPIYITVLGAVCLGKGVMNIFFALIMYKKKKDGTFDPNKDGKRNPINSVMNLFIFVWFVVGSAFVYIVQLNVNYDYANSPMYCNKFIYQFAFRLVTALYGVLGFIMFCSAAIFVTMQRAKSTNTTV